MGLKSFLQNAGLVKGNQPNWAEEFDLNTTFDTVKSVFPARLQSFNGYGSAWQQSLTVNSQFCYCFEFSCIEGTTPGTHRYTFSPTADGKVHAKLEFNNPTGIAKSQVEQQKQRINKILGL